MSSPRLPDFLLLHILLVLLQHRHLLHRRHQKVLPRLQALRHPLHLLLPRVPLLVLLLVLDLIHIGLNDNVV